MKTITPAEMPAPDTIVKLSGGHLCAAMFYYASEGDDFKAIALENGFELRVGVVEDEDLSDDAREAWARDGNLALWQPEIPEGWQLAGKWDTEDGPAWVAVRPLKASK